MAAPEEIEQVIALLQKSVPGNRYQQVSKTTMGIGAVLLFLSQAEESVSAGQISHHMDVSTARVAALLKKMESKRLIVTGRSAADARVTTVVLTEYGRQVFAQMEAELHHKIACLIDRIGLQRLIEFTNISAEIQTVLGEKPAGLVRRR